MPPSGRGASASSDQQPNNNSTTRTGMALPAPSKTTASMAAALTSLYGTLLCPLCQITFTSPHTLPSCGHTFCLDCISDYACDSWECPYEGCAMPISVGKDCGDMSGRTRVGGGSVSGELGWRCCTHAYQKLLALVELRFAFASQLLVSSRA